MKLDIFHIRNLVRIMKKIRLRCDGLKTGQGDVFEVRIPGFSPRDKVKALVRSLNGNSNWP
jgi:hypothetical protein